jgi:ethanolamine utilization protein EutP
MTMTRQRVVFQEMDYITTMTTEGTSWRFMLIGGVGAGKTTLLKTLENKNPQLVSKTQMIDYSGWGIDTPGEFIEMGHLRRVLVSSSFDAKLLIAVQDATRREAVFPPNYFLMFPQHVISVVTKMDDKEADPDQAQAQLQAAGVTGEIFYVSAITGYGISELRAYLLETIF